MYKNRPKSRAGLRKVGGGVSIVFNKATCNLRERKIQGNKYELVLAVGKVGRLQRQVAIFCLYIEPRMKVAELSALNDLISDEILRLKSKGDPLIYIGGDLNRRDLSNAIHNFGDIKQINSAPTRGDVCLDVLYSNAADITSTVEPPLETPAGVRSDHCCVVFSGKEQRIRDFIWVKKTVRKHSGEAVDEFGKRLAEADWDHILPNDAPPDVLVQRFQQWATRNTDELFPMQTVRCRSNEFPWVTHAIRRLSRIKKRVHKREGKSALWRALQTRMEQSLEHTKSEYVDRIEKSGSNTRKYFGAIKKLSSASPSNDEWSLTSLFPGQTDVEASEEAAKYFTRITDQFEPLRPSTGTIPLEERRRPMTEEEVAAKLRDAKKPDSSVEGDLLPRVVKAHHRLMAKPAMKIFNAVFATGCWPAAWKTETTVIIPKVAAPDSLGDCRNISCTPFLSKVLESVLLADLRAEIPDDPTQYGGLKGSSVDHLLVDMFDKLLEPLESGASSLVLAIDYEKAFNRLDHAECLSQLRRLGASETSVNLVRSFLTQRSMRVRIGKLLSSSHPLRGGSPQGSILGCFLYCATTQQINTDIHTQAPRTPGSPRSPPAAGNSPWGHQSAGEEEEGGMALLNTALSTSSGSVSSVDSFVTAQGSLDRSGEDSMEMVQDGLALTIVKYIDDTTVVLTLPPGPGTRHISTGRPEEMLDARQLEAFLEALSNKADSIGMRVNCRKTQLMCVSPDTGYATWAAVKSDGIEIRSQQTLKLLGFMMGTGPGVSDHFDLLRRKFRARFWALIHLRRAGIKGIKLFKLYAALVRPVLEVNAVVYHPMLTSMQSSAIERMQKQVVRLCFGHDVPYAAALENMQLETLKERRIKATRKFVGKALVNARYSGRWFQARPEVETDIRRRRPFIERRARTERYRTSPLLHFQRIANDIMTMT